MRFFLFPFLFLFFLPLSAQDAVTGSVRETVSKQPIAYVNIGVVGRNRGTVSGNDGSFSIVLESRFDADVLRLSAIGYKTIEMPVSEFRLRMLKSQDVFLEKDVRALQEVVVRNFTNAAEWGNTDIDRREKVTAGFVNNVLGNELGMVFKAKKKPARVMAFHALIAYNHYEKLRFRMNFYSMKNGFPCASLLSENIIVTSDKKSGLLNVDLTDYGIVVEGDFFVSLEWIEGLGEGGLHFVADYSGPQLITRAASQGTWNKQDDLSFAFSVSVKY